MLRYLEIENFKVFGEKVRIDLTHPAVMIGPNNAGKTSVLQALALWNHGVRAWFEKKGEMGSTAKGERLSAGINRLNILEIPVSETRLFWYNTRVRKGNTPIELMVRVGLEHQGREKICSMIFKQRDNEVIYCRPCDRTIEDADLLHYVASLRINLLYPMSGIETEEPLIQEGRINVLMGQGQTAQVLRNLCYRVYEKGPDDWNKVAYLMEKLFRIRIHPPSVNVTRGTLDLKYRQEGVENELDISLSGRGLQQMLLILSYLYSHKRSVLMIDEPDAHLEILRQRQVYEILRTVARENDSQVIIATHSEVILEDAVDTNLTLLINGEAVNLARQQDMKNALRTFGIDHYYKAKIHPRILYTEGSTDIEMLKALALKLNHRAYDILSGTVYSYYTQNIRSEDSLEMKLEKAGGAFGNFKQHFYTLRNFVPDFRGIAIFDSDGQMLKDEVTKELAIVYWKQYELENYFITPEVILRYIDRYYNREYVLFGEVNFQKAQEIIDLYLLENLFDHNRELLEEYKSSSPGIQRKLLQNHKMSKLAETVLSGFSSTMGLPLPLVKGNYYQLAECVDEDEIPREVIEKLDLLVEYLSW